MVRGRTFGGNWLVTPLCEQGRLASAEPQGARDQRLLDVAIPPTPLLVLQIAVVERRDTRGEVDWPAIVGIDQAEVPKLRALVEVRDARHGEPKQGLPQAVESTGGGNAVDQCHDLVQ